MTDREIIKAELKRRMDIIKNGIGDPALTGHDRADASLRYEVMGSILLLIDSLPKESVINPTPNEKMSIERWRKAVEAACNDANYRSNNGMTETRDDYFVDGVQWADEHPIEKPVSEDLEEAAADELDNQNPNWTIDASGSDGEYIEDAYNEIQMKNMFKTGAKWQKQKDMLTCKDMKEIWNFGDSLPPMAEEDFYKAMLEHFNEKKYGKQS